VTEVHVVDRAAFFGGDWPQGFTPIGAGEADEFLARALARGRFVDRPTAERTPAWKQWIPYCVLRCGAPDWDRSAPADRGVLLVQRTRGQSETRLHGSWSIGLGGHVEPLDLGPGRDGATFFADSLRRELTEELRFGDLPLPAPRLLGLINDDSTEVGSVHAGLAYVLDLPLPVATARARVGIGEISKMRGGFTHLVGCAELWQNPAQFETWSQLLIRAGVIGHSALGTAPSDASGTSAWSTGG
jgi:predicted NUDIX family phosphoesterase